MLIPCRNFILCEKIEPNRKEGGLILPTDKTKTVFSTYRVVRSGNANLMDETFTPGDLIIVDEGQVNEISYNGKIHYLICETFVCLHDVRELDSIKEN